MSHLTDDDLVLHYYGEDGPRLVATERHLRSCAQCAGAYDTLARTLRAVTPPEFVEAADEMSALRQRLRDRLMGQQSPARVFRPVFGEEAGLTVLVWLVPVLYPLSFQALFSSAQLAQSHIVGMLLVALTLMWTCGGPFVAVWALNRMVSDRLERASGRLRFWGALMAAISPPLFLLVSRVNVSLSLNLGLWLWYGAIALGSLMALFRWPTAPQSTTRFLYVHRISALVLSVFVLAHVINQALAFFSVSSYVAMRSVMRVASQQPALYTLIVGAVVIQIATGAAVGVKKVRAGAAGRNLQVVSGWYLAAFLLMHVFSGLLLSQPQATATPFNQFDLLAGPRSTAQLPYLVLGVAAFLFHVGIYARLAALAYLAEASVRRLSYAAVVVGTTVVVTVGLALCGIRLIP